MRHYFLLVGIFAVVFKVSTYIFIIDHYSGRFFSWTNASVKVPSRD